MALLRPNGRFGPVLAGDVAERGAGDVKRPRRITRAGRGRRGRWRSRGHRACAPACPSDASPRSRRPLPGGLRTAACAQLVSSLLPWLAVTMLTGGGHTRARVDVRRRRYRRERDDEEQREPPPEGPARTLHCSRLSLRRPPSTGGGRPIRGGPM